MVMASTQTKSLASQHAGSCGGYQHVGAIGTAPVAPGLPTGETVPEAGGLPAQSTAAGGTPRTVRGEGDSLLTLVTFLSCTQ